MQDTINFHKKGIPVVCVVTRQFENLARVLLQSEGYPFLPLVVVPHPFTTLPRGEVTELADEFKEEILSAIAVDTGNLEVAVTR